MQGAWRRSLLIGTRCQTGGSMRSPLDTEADRRLCLLLAGLTPLDLIGPLQTTGTRCRASTPTFEVVVVAENDTDAVATDAVGQARAP
jgi:hypothetical protein